MNPFEGRTKEIRIRTVAEVLDAIRQHRQEAHGTTDLEEFFDCSACGLLEHRLRSAIDVKEP